MDHTFAANIGAYETWEFAMQETPQAAPCLDCGTTGAMLRCASGRWRGLCKTCYHRHYSRGTHTNFDLSPHVQVQQLGHPLPLPDRLTLTSSREPWGAPHQPEWQACAAWERQDTADRWPSYGPTQPARRTA